MRITVCCTDTKTAPWIEGLRAALPDATVEEWHPGAPQADHAVVWAPPQAFLDEQPALKGLFNIGAGVDALLKLSLPPQSLIVRLGDRSARAVVYTQGETDHVFTAEGAASIVSIDLLAHAGDDASDAGRLTAPMPGKVVSFSVKAGDKVAKGQALAVMEAMKMEHTIAAPADGVVAELLYAPGDQVAEGAELLKINV